jgi:hypothetical protein
VEKFDKADGHLGLLDRTEKLLSQTKEIETSDTNIADDVASYINELRNNNNIQEAEDRIVQTQMISNGK